MAVSMYDSQAILGLLAVHTLTQDQVTRVDAVTDAGVTFLLSLQTNGVLGDDVVAAALVYVKKACRIAQGAISTES